MSTPARRQYLEIKAQHPDALLLYQMGDFYELFDEDARIAARDLNITLTSREFGRSGRVPMAGVPVAAVAGYLRRLLAKGHRAALCDQVGNAQQHGPGLIDRYVRCVVTPGTATDPSLISPTENGYLIALLEGKEGLGLATLDASTGEFACTQFGSDEEAELAGELARLQPHECLVVPAGESGAEGPTSAPRSLLRSLGTPLTDRDAWRFGPEAAARRLREQFGVASVEAFGLGAEWLLALGAAGAIVDYLAETNRQLLTSLRALQSYSTRSFVRLDLFTRRNLELFRSARTGDRHQSLFAVIDRTKTAVGGRLLRRWLGQPLTDAAELGRRHDAVEALVDHSAERRALRTDLAHVSDLERIVARLRQGLVTPREVLGIPATLAAVPPLIDALNGLTAPPLRSLRQSLDPCLDLADLIRRALSDSPGELIRPGYSQELDEVRTAAAEARQWVAKLEQTERARTGIKTLKVGYNRVFGYYLEVTRPNLPAVPGEYRRTQTLANAERFITAELKQHETVIVNAQDRVTALETRLFEELVRTLAAAGQRLRDLAGALAHLDVYAALADLADAERYVRPILHEGPEIEIEGGRHPVVEARLPPGDFVPNDIGIGSGHGRILLITGPNMAGKSTCLRQVALICLLGQIGSFVPAAAARIGLVDRIFTRIGAQDDLAAGASTFLVEMVETANILLHASDRSLVILDEIGRGTSTWDGLAIARAVLEHLHESGRIRCLFATHYHELVPLTETLPELRAYQLTAVEIDGDIVFLRRLQSGGAERSYGIQVARLAGLPAGVLERAGRLLAGFEARDPARSGPGATTGDARPGPPEGDAPDGRVDDDPPTPAPSAKSRPAVADDAPLVVPADPPAFPVLQPGFWREAGWGTPADDLARELLSLDVTDLTPLEALNRLAALQSRLRSRLGGAPVIPRSFRVADGIIPATDSLPRFPLLSGKGNGRPAAAREGRAPFGTAEEE